jgi:hypothetical protein
MLGYLMISDQLPRLHAWPNPKSIVMADNARIHKNQEVHDAFEEQRKL